MGGGIGGGIYLGRFRFIWVDLLLLALLPPLLSPHVYLARPNIGHSF